MEAIGAVAFPPCWRMMSQWFTAQRPKRRAQITARTPICSATSRLVTFQQQRRRRNNPSKHSALDSAGVWSLLLSPADATTVWGHRSNVDAAGGVIRPWWFALLHVSPSELCSCAGAVNAGSSVCQRSRRDKRHIQIIDPHLLRGKATAVFHCLNRLLVDCCSKCGEKKVRGLKGGKSLVWGGLSSASSMIFCNCQNGTTQRRWWDVCTCLWVSVCVPAWIF